MRHVVVLDHPLFLAPLLHVENDDIFMVVEMQTNFSEFDFNVSE